MSGPGGGRALKKVDMPLGKLPRASLASSAVIQEKSAVNNLGVLYTGYLEKRNPVTGSYKQRFMVLTNEAVHWFKREEHYDLFGEERGHVGLGSILNIRVLDTDGNTFMLQSTDDSKRMFRCNTPTAAEEWVSAIRSAIKNFTTAAHPRKSVLSRRQSLSGINAMTFGEASSTSNDTSEVTVMLISLRSSTIEIVLSRNPQWDRMIKVPNVKKGDVVVISTSNGGNVTLTAEAMLAKADEGVDFEAAVQGVTLASSLRISINRDEGDNVGIIVPSKSSSSSSSSSKSEKSISSLSSTSSKKSTLNSTSGSSPSYFSIFAKTLGHIVKNKRNAFGLVLSSMILFVSFGTLRYLSPDTSLLFVFALLLATYSIYTAISEAVENSNNSVMGQDLIISIHGHSFTSPDAPINEPDDEIPKRFLDGCMGDLEEARRRWDITKHWREAEGINTILEEEQPHFKTIKLMYPHYHAGRGKQGHVVFYERPGDLEGAQLSARGIKTDQLIRHWLFMTEYQWQILCKGDDTAKSIAVLDVGTVKFGDLVGDNLAFVKRSVGYANVHYPERSFVIYIINAPTWFTFMWAVIKPMVHENTQKKVRILSKSQTLEGLQEHIDISQIPEYYGGKLKFGDDEKNDSCRWRSDEVVALNKFVEELNGRFTTTTHQPFDSHDDKHNLPPGRPGDNPSESSGSTHSRSYTTSTEGSSAKPRLSQTFSPSPPASPLSPTSPTSSSASSTSMGRSGLGSLTQKNTNTNTTSNSSTVGSPASTETPLRQIRVSRSPNGSNVDVTPGDPDVWSISSESTPGNHNPSSSNNSNNNSGTMTQKRIAPHSNRYRLMSTSNY